MIEIASQCDDLIAPPAPEAFYGLAGDFTRLIAPETEADEAALLLSFLVTSGGAFGRAAHCIADGAVHYPNEYVILVGDTGRGRKGTAGRHVRKVANCAIENFSTDHEFSGLSTGEGLIRGIEQKKQLGVSNFIGFLPEFGRLLAVARREGNTISAVIRESWDGDHLSVLTKTLPLSVSDYTLSLIGHVTPEELLNGLGSVDLVNGLANRFLFAKVRRSKLLPEGGNDVNIGPIVHRLHSAIEIAQNRGRIRRDERAKELWCQIYPQLTDQPKGLKGSLCSRADAHTLRLSLTYALLDGAAEIRLEHLQAAHAVWQYCERSIGSIFASRLGDFEAEKILRCLESGPKTISEIHRGAFNNNRAKEWLLAKLAAMVKAGVVAETSKIGDRKLAIPAWDKVRSTNQTGGK